jgi:hypothetical protein
MTEIENEGGGGDQADMCQEFVLVNSINQTIWKNRTKIINRLEQNRLRIKGFQKREQNDVDEALLTWFKQGRSDTVPVSSPLTKTTFILLNFNFKLMYFLVQICMEIYNNRRIIPISEF